MQIGVDLMFESIVLKIDELDGRLRGFYEKLKKYVKSRGENHEFIQREVRQNLGISKSSLQRYLQELEELEYVSKGGRGRNGAGQYRIIYWDDNSALRERIRKDLQSQLALMARS